MVSTSVIHVNTWIMEVVIENENKNNNKRWKRKKYKLIT